MTNTNDNQDFPEVEAWGLTQEVPDLAEADTDDAAGEWKFKNRRDPNTYEPSRPLPVVMSRKKRRVARSTPPRLQWRFWRKLAPMSGSRTCYG